MVLDLLYIYVNPVIQKQFQFEYSKSIPINHQSIKN